ncbi:hypothetical protein K7I13_11455 [Brucepastera parasyntrophica]|uniref:hypothetical protein n=1 Tax=Brucepastera parasyntrophica TaxID=2880008 RepID=UPI00210C840D|nr:hypothetical protein [Brucepastera parasyntrophica]ULQ59117.1 hypothetical protein K7I13_11455 [Brucepastera parasyntrophica]
MTEAFAVVQKRGVPLRLIKTRKTPGEKNAAWKNTLTHGKTQLFYNEFRRERGLLFLQLSPGENPLRFVDPTGLNDEEPETKAVPYFKNLGEMFEAFMAGNNKAREAIIGTQANDALNSGEHVLVDESASEGNGGKGLYLKAEADLRLDQGELNVNAEAGGAKISGTTKPIFESVKKNFKVELEGEIKGAAADAFIGMKENSLGIEAVVSLIDFSGSINLRIFSNTIKIGGNVYIGGIGAGASFGLKNTIKAAKGVGFGLFLQVIPNEAESQQ